MAIHRFSSSGEAYDATQCDERIVRGDVLVVASEGVIGVADTWPIALGDNFGKLHSVIPGCERACMIDVGLTPDMILGAVIVADIEGIEINPVWREIATDGWEPDAV